MKCGQQTTLRNEVLVEGRGVHGNKPVRIVLKPAEANVGVRFLLKGRNFGHERLLRALWSEVSMTQLCTVIGHGSSGSVGTIEHLMAAICGLGLDNVHIEIDGPEVPIMDGSAQDFVQLIDDAGIVTQKASRRFLKILKKVRIENGPAFAELAPARRGFKLDVAIDFTNPMIGAQRFEMELDAKKFRKEVAGARTFGFVSDVKKLWSMGLALGSSLQNSVAIEGERVLNPEGLRFKDEFVRHKMLDAIGDLALAGAPIIGSYTSLRGGHKMNVAVLEALFADSAAFAFVQDSAPARPVVGRAELGLAGVAAFAPGVD